MNSTPDVDPRQSIRIGIVKISNDSTAKGRVVHGSVFPHSALGVYPHGPTNSNNMIEDGLRHFAMLDKRISKNQRRVRNKHRHINLSGS